MSNFLAFAFFLCIAGQHAVCEPDQATAEAHAMVNSTPLNKILTKNLTNDELASHLNDFAKRCRSIARLHVIGNSVKGVPLTVIILHGGTQDAAARPVPAFRYTGNLHGDEPSGRQLLLGLAEWLCERRLLDEEAGRLLHAVELHLLPTANPDGYTLRSRTNWNGVDLNRDFPGVINTTAAARNAAPLLRTGREQPETVALMDWAASRPFVASAALHEGALVANYPWDASENGEGGYCASPDDSAFRFLASKYATTHAKMSQASEFVTKGGITNGAEWYQIWGSMQDWSYVDQQCMELTLEVSEEKHPPTAALPGLFDDNLRAMLALPLTAAVGGVSGFVKDSRGRPLQANISVVGIASHVTSSSDFGAFYRVLAPGNYILVAQAMHHVSSRYDILVPQDGSGARHNFTLQRSGHKSTAPVAPRWLGLADSHKEQRTDVDLPETSMAVAMFKGRKLSPRFSVMPHYAIGLLLLAVTFIVCAWSHRFRRHRRQTRLK